MRPIICFKGCSISRQKCWTLLILSTLILYLTVRHRGQQNSEKSDSKGVFRIMGEVVSSTRNEREVNLTRGLSRLQKITKLCSFYDPLVNQSIPLNCSSKSFVSIVRSRCKTRLGNQLSSYAAVLYFQKK